VEQLHENISLSVYLSCISDVVRLSIESFKSSYGNRPIFFLVGATVFFKFNLQWPYCLSVGNQQEELCTFNVIGNFSPVLQLLLCNILSK